MIISHEYTIFGSSDSSDLDVMFYVNKIPQPQECKELILKLKSYLKLVYFEYNHPDSYFDPNLCVVSNGIVVDCFKGTVDEVNNMLHATQKLHTQYHRQRVYTLLKRNVEEKAARALRGILSYNSRTKYRSIVKPALRGDARLKIDTIREMDLGSIIDTGQYKVTIKDFYKLFAFQLGQTLALIDGIELYDKKSIVDRYPDFKPYLYRLNNTWIDIDIWKVHFLDMIEKKLDLLLIQENVN